MSTRAKGFCCFAFPANHERAAGVHQVPSPQGLAAQQHAKSHLITVGQRQFDGVARLADFQNRANYRAFFALSARVGNGAMINDQGNAFDLGRAAPLHRMEIEPNVRCTVLREGREPKGMQSRRSRTRIQFGFDLGDFQIRQPHPFAPTHNFAFWSC